MFEQVSLADIQKVWESLSRRQCGKQAAEQIEFRFFASQLQVHACVQEGHALVCARAPAFIQEPSVVEKAIAQDFGPQSRPDCVKGDWPAAKYLEGRASI